jgi:tetratricopeptide (TPR) repeat protein
MYEIKNLPLENANDFGYLWERGLYFTIGKDFNHALLYYDKLNNLFPNNDDIFYMLGATLNDLGRRYEAIKYLQQIKTNDINLVGGI